MENDKSLIDSDVLTKVIGDNACVECAESSTEIRSDGEVIAEACAKCVESSVEASDINFYPIPRAEITPEIAKQRKGTFNYRFAKFMTRRPGLTMVSAIYFFALAVAAVALVVLNNDTVMAGTSLYYEGGTRTVSAVIWSFIGVISFLFLLAIVYAVAVLSSRKNVKLAELEE